MQSQTFLAELSQSLVKAASVFENKSLGGDCSLREKHTQSVYSDRGLEYVNMDSFLHSIHRSATFLVYRDINF